MLLVAGSIEGFISPSAIPARLKFLLAAVLFTALVAYLNRARQPHDEQLAEAEPR
jgi:hypothetical protein